MRGTLTIAGGAEVQLPFTARLGAVRPGDVFYLLREPSVVWGKSEDFEDYPFQPLGNEREFELDEVGRPDEAVVVVHSTMTDKRQEGVLASQP